MGKTLYLLRHAKSSWQDPTLADHDRPLASRGRRASSVIADHLRRQQITPTLVLCSSSTRTRETLETIGETRHDYGWGCRIRCRVLLKARAHVYPDRRRCR
jgi:phosphohistidine phosphatase SixA